MKNTFRSLLEVGALLFGGGLLLGTTGCGFKFYERGLPKRVEVKRQASEPKAKIAVQELPARELEISVARGREVALEREIVYGTVEAYVDWKRNPAWELIELPVGVILLPGAPIALTGIFDIPDSPTMKSSTIHSRLFPFSYINPLQPMIGADFVRDPSSELELFRSPSVRTPYRMALPQSNVAVTYRLLDSNGKEVAHGDGKTDSFGTIRIASVPAPVTRIEVKADGATLSRVIRFAGVDE